ncbi:hypothetical protein [Roseibium sediminis]|uniref:hypothetical protein n=1 Tax=Roseibium sediminis TaxID=1775174 RepID=UPI00123D5472|nr:hypothetical protein [Roseibium sediminis]
MSGDTHPQIYGCGLASVAGATTPEAAKAILKGQPFFHRVRECVGADGQDQIMAAKIPYFEERDIITRLRRLFDEAYQECLQSLDGKMATSQKVTLHLALPVWMNQSTDLKQAFQDRFNQDTPELVLNVICYFEGPTGGLTAFIEACKEIREGKKSAALVCGLDSHIAPWLIDAMQFTTGVIGKGNPYGTVPGEAAAMVFLSSKSHMGAAKSLGTIRTLATLEEKQQPMDVNGSIMGAALSSCFRGVIERLPEGVHPELVLGDLNGQRHRAEEYGYALSSLKDAGEAFLDPVILPVSIGDVGVACGLLMIIVGLYYEYQEYPVSILWGSCPSGMRYAASLEVTQEKNNTL